MRVLITGGTGYIGGRLALALHERGWTVTATGRRDAPTLRAAGIPLSSVDLRTANAAQRLFQTGFDVVVHCAAWLGSRGDPGAGVAVNVDVTRSLAETAAFAGVGRFVHLSSVAAVGPPGDRTQIDPETPPNDKQAYPYGRTKAAGEREVERVARERGLPAVVVRPGLVHGPGSLPWTRDLSSQIAKGWPLQVGPGDGIASLVYIDHLIEALVAIAEHPNPGGPRLHVVDPPVTWRQLLQAHAEHQGRTLRSLPTALARLLAWLSAVGLPTPLTPHRLDWVLSKANLHDASLRPRLGLGPELPFSVQMEESWRWLASLESTRSQPSSV